MSKRANYRPEQIRQMIVSACLDGVYPSYDAMRKRHPGFGAHHGTFTRVRDHMVLKGLELPDNPRERHTMHDGFMRPDDPRFVKAPEVLTQIVAKKASGVPYKTPVVIMSSPDQTKPKAPWQPSWAVSWHSGLGLKANDIVDAVRDYRHWWRHLHLPPKEQRVTGTNRNQGVKNMRRLIPDHSRWLNPPIIDKGMPPWHPRGQGI